MHKHSPNSLDRCSQGFGQSACHSATDEDPKLPVLHHCIILQKLPSSKTWIEIHRVHAPPFVQTSIYDIMIAEWWIKSGGSGPSRRMLDDLRRENSPGSPFHIFCCKFRIILRQLRIFARNLDHEVRASFLGVGLCDCTAIESTEHSPCLRPPEQPVVGFYPCRVTCRCLRRWHSRL